MTHRFPDTLEEGWADRLGRTLRAHRWAVAAAGLGLAIGVAVGAPVVSGALGVWDRVVTPGFLNLYLSGIPLCS